MQSVSTFNQTGKAKKQLSAKAASSRLPYELVEFLYGFHWNLDGREGTWIYESHYSQDEAYHRRCGYLSAALNLPEKTLSRQEAAAALLRELAATDEAVLLDEFLTGAAAKDYCRVSRFASYWYLRNANETNLQDLEWPADGTDRECVAGNVFSKIFRGGAIERYHLDYLYADLVVRLPFQSRNGEPANWLDGFLKEVKAAAAKPSLTELRNMLKRHLKGDKHFLQTVLEALSYSGHLAVAGHPVTGIFIPGRRHESSSHFYSNEWTYPLRFW